MMIPFGGVMVLLITTWLSKGAEGAIGLNWGRVSSQRLVPSMVVDLMLQNGIRDARIFSSQPDIMEAFAGSGINLSLNAFYIHAIKTPALCDQWVQDRKEYLTKANVRRVYIGTLVFKEGLTNKSLLLASLNSMELLQKSLDKAGFGGKIQVGMAHPDAVLTHRTKPSQAEFRPEIMDQMLRYLRFIRPRNYPFVIETFPIEYVMLNNLDPSFAFCDNKSTHIVRDLNGTLYTNAFDYLYDSFVWALQKVGASDVDIIVSQVGWPTDGYPGANASNAERFHKTFLPKVVSNMGTPMRPGRPIDVFVHSIADENKIPTTEFAHYRHWGIYRSNGEPKYKIDLSGRGRDIYPSKAKGIMRMPDRWCVFNRDTTDNEKLKAEFLKACKDADCTSLAPGGSCSQLDFYQNISYAFNMYFQSKFQEEEACDFMGLGEVVTSDPSEGSCVFPVEVVRGQQNMRILGDNNNNNNNNIGARHYHDHVHGCGDIFVLVFWILWLLLL